MPAPGRPDETEFNPHAKGYVDAVDGDDVLQALTTQLGDFIELTSTLDGAYRYTPGKWTVNEVVGHINDTERILAYRLLAIARNDKTALPGFEQDDYMAVSNFNERHLSELQEEFELIRKSTIHMIGNLPGDAWLRRGTVWTSSVTARGLAFTLAGHERHHSRILREKYLSK
jgi:hypothetical protein